MASIIYKGVNKPKTVLRFLRRNILHRHNKRENVFPNVEKSVVYSDFKKVISTLHSCILAEHLEVTDRLFNLFLIKYFDFVDKAGILAVTPRAERDTFITIYNFEKQQMYGKIYEA